jgi:catechol 2,3-dioxygenase-like lactoylglutathione lyase family enzyme
MAVRRIVANVAAQDLEKADAFYRDILQLDVLMDLGWIRTYGADTQMTVQISIAQEGGSGTVVPDLSIEVEDLDQVLARLRAANVPIEYGPVVEPWGVFRCYVRDPFGRLVNLLEHRAPVDD